MYEHILCFFLDIIPAKSVDVNDLNSKHARASFFLWLEVCCSICIFPLRKEVEVRYSGYLSRFVMINDCLSAGSRRFEA